MKALVLVLFTLLMGKGCSQSNADLASAKLTYTAHSRGIHKVIVLENKELTYENGRGKDATLTASTLSDSEWESLVGQFKTISLEQLNTYADPTQARFYDGAAIANLTIEYKGNTYRTKDFDHGTPPVEIQPLITSLLALIKE